MCGCEMDIQTHIESARATERERESERLIFMTKKINTIVCEQASTTGPARHTHTRRPHKLHRVGVSKEGVEREIY